MLFTCHSLTLPISAESCNWLSPENALPITEEISNWSRETIATKSKRGRGSEKSEELHWLVYLLLDRTHTGRHAQCTSKRSMMSIAMHSRNSRMPNAAKERYSLLCHRVVGFAKKIRTQTTQTTQGECEIHWFARLANDEFCGDRSCPWRRMSCGQRIKRLIKRQMQQHITDENQGRRGCSLSKVDGWVEQHWRDRFIPKKTMCFCDLNVLRIQLSPAVGKTSFA
jgi:hypothetical protein